MKQFAVLTLLVTLGVQALPDRSPYIVNGYPVAHQPYNAYVQYLNAVNAGYFGGGSIISNRHIITAAQNIYGFVRWDIGLGSNVYNQLSMLTTTMATFHPNFNTVTRANDIGIITLMNAISLTSTIAPISMPSLQEQYQLPLENEQGTIVGFGLTSSQSTARSDILIRSFQRVTAGVRCQQYYLITIPNHFCAEDTTEISNICNGDIGAGFATYSGNSPLLTGIASLITSNCASGTPSAYTRIVPYRQWIQQVTGV
ncbi:brachyurin-like [Sabethes cyaneus]|uniref:brachyurin-like n=1 Tax=Sabethes cyaneus TaxID=53552 RepID=UPI00237D6366|nr:brachyurin-like [Sabethes cyaneus]